MIEKEWVAEWITNGLSFDANWLSRSMRLSSGGMCRVSWCCECGRHGKDGVPEGDAAVREEGWEGGGVDMVEGGDGPARRCTRPRRMCSCGGRRLNINNYESLFVDGKPMALLICSGANLYITNSGRVKLEDVADLQGLERKQVWRDLVERRDPGGAVAGRRAVHKSKACLQQT